jgi:chromosome segregation ATPase
MTWKAEEEDNFHTQQTTIQVRIRSEEEKITAEKSRIEQEQHQIQKAQSELNLQIKSANHSLHDELASWQSKSDQLDEEIEALYQQIKLKQHQKQSISNTIQELQLQIRSATQPFMEDQRRLDITEQLLAEQILQVTLAEQTLSNLRNTLDQTIQTQHQALASHEQEIDFASTELSQVSLQLKEFQSFFESLCNGAIDNSPPEVFQEYSR